MDLDSQIRPIWNVIGTMRGAEFPDAWIILGNPHDAWTYAAVDPNRGTTALLDVARALALAPNDPVILLERGNIRRLTGDDAGAREDWLRILMEAPESPSATAAQANLQRLDLRLE